MTTQDALRAQARAALARAEISQAAAARQLGVSTKHMSQMLTGRAPLSPDWADRIVSLCGLRLVVAVDLTTADINPTTKGPTR